MKFENNKGIKAINERIAYLKSLGIKPKSKKLKELDIQIQSLKQKKSQHYKF